MRKLLEILHALVEQGNTVVVPRRGEQSGGLFDRTHAKHDVIKTADWIIDLGPEGGVKGGEIVAAGVPEAVAAVPESFTGRYLKPLLKGGAGETTVLSEAAE